MSVGLRVSVPVRADLGTDLFYDIEDWRTDWLVVQLSDVFFYSDWVEFHLCFYIVRIIAFGSFLDHRIDHIQGVDNYPGAVTILMQVAL